jgi:hypothetical protein
MPLMTKELIIENLEDFGGIIATGPRTWIFRTHWGREITIHETHIDFRGIRRKVKGETEEDRGQIEFELNNLASEVFGSISYAASSRCAADWSEAWVVALVARSYGFKTEKLSWPFSRAHVENSLRDKATIKSKGRGWRISLRNGSFVQLDYNANHELVISGVAGGRNVYGGAIRLLAEVQGIVPVSGTKANIQAGLAYESHLPGVEIVPELYSTFRTHFVIGAISGIFGFMGIGIGLNSDHPGMWIAGGYLVTAVVACLWLRAVAPGGLQGARERGQALRSSFPPVHGGDRNAKLEDAKKRKMLE